ncbi:hypothetical protein Taro_010643 [Colocasia esculenta]|uniref:Uncharacterized protein n=1 Tax=Colocasia esculenta TaxID=4460 RepID=A0A843TZF3_COLES|nr:hypothetical protein [Colocasia esculenta]
MRIAGGAHTRSRPVTAIGSRVQLDARSPPQNRNSETVDRALVSRNSVPGSKFPPRSVCTSTPTAVPSGRARIFIRPGVRTAREASTKNRHFDPVAKELGITFSTGIGIAYVTTIRNRHSETVDRALVLRNSVPGPKFPP